MKERESRKPAIEDLFDQVVALFHALQGVAASVHRDTGLTAAERGVLKGIERLGPQTVPRMARARPVSRQYIQAVVNRLVGKGLLEEVPNPEHRRSPLVTLSDGGRKMAASVAVKERDFLRKLSLDAREEELRLAASVLRRVGSGLTAAGGKTHRRSPGKARIGC